MPERFAAWDAVFPVLYASVDLAEAKSASAISAGILARKTRDRLAPALASLRLQQPASEPAALWDATIGWLAATVRAWSRGDMPDAAQ
jgi:hypothetical protein